MRCKKRNETKQNGTKKKVTWKTNKIWNRIHIYCGIGAYWNYIDWLNCYWIQWSGWVQSTILDRFWLRSIDEPTNMADRNLVNFAEFLIVIPSSGNENSNKKNNITEMDLKKISIIGKNAKKKKNCQRSHWVGSLTRLRFLLHISLFIRCIALTLNKQLAPRWIFETWVHGTRMERFHDSNE